jgi:hypothetical protein
MTGRTSTSPRVTASSKPSWGRAQLPALDHGGRLARHGGPRRAHGGAAQPREGVGQGAGADRDAGHRLARARPAPPGLWGPGVIARRLAAACLPRRQRALGACCRRRNARLGTPTAITAPAQTLARAIDTRLRHGTASVHPSLADDDPPSRARTGQRLTHRAKALGSALGNTPARTLAGSSRPRSSSLEGPQWSRARQPLGADFSFFSALGVPARLASGRVSRLDCRMPAQTDCGCATHVLRLDRPQDDDGQETRVSSAA